jgi:predicted nucleic acid-binding protein
MLTGCFLGAEALIERQTLSSEFQRILRRLKPEKHRVTLKPRPESELEFVEFTSTRPTRLLYDTTVYIDILQDRFPRQGDNMLRAAEAWHSPVTEAELAVTCGLLDPTHARTRAITQQILEVIDRRPRHRTLATDSEVWGEAGVLSGTLARLQGYKSDQRRRVLNDALLFATARKHGCSLLTRNVLDFDFLQQLDPSGKVLFYR